MLRIPNYARDHTGLAIIRGKVIKASGLLTLDGLVRANIDFVLKDAVPFQTNNMTEWLIQASHHCNDPEFKKSVLMSGSIEGLGDVRYIINDGAGRKKGHGSRFNRFTIIVPNIMAPQALWGKSHWNLIIDITTIAHAQLTKLRHKNGEPIRDYGGRQTWEDSQWRSIKRIKVGDRAFWSRRLEKWFDCVEIIPIFGAQFGVSPDQAPRPDDKQLMRRRVSDPNGPGGYL